MFYTYDQQGLLTGTSITNVPDSTPIPYPDGMGFFQFIQGNWQLIFGADINGDLTITPGAVKAKAYKPPFKRSDLFVRNPLYTLGADRSVDPAQLTLDPAYPDLTEATLDALFIAAEPLVRASALFIATGAGLELIRDYAVYRRGDSSYYAVGLSWVTADNRAFNAKIVNGVISDFYEMYQSGDYHWAELDAVTFEPVALYIEGGEKKLDPITLEVLQQNYSSDGLNGVPQDFADEMLAKGLHFVNEIFQYGSKPYGETVAFTVPLQ